MVIGECGNSLVILVSVPRHSYTVSLPWCQLRKEKWRHKSFGAVQLVPFIVFHATSEASLFVRVWIRVGLKGLCLWCNRCHFYCDWAKVNSGNWVHLWRQSPNCSSCFDWLSSVGHADMDFRNSLPSAVASWTIPSDSALPDPLESVGFWHLLFCLLGVLALSLCLSLCLCFCLSLSVCFSLSLSLCFSLSRRCWPWMHFWLKSRASKSWSLE